MIGSASRDPAFVSFLEMQTQAGMMRFLGLDARDKFKGVHKALIEAYVSIVRGLQPDAVLEIGAHEARFSRMARKKLPQIPIIAFEANPDVHATHVGRLTAERIDYRNQAISDSEGKLTFRVPLVRGNEARTMGSIMNFNDHSEYVEHSVPAITMDSLGLQRVVLWIDVEGATEQVLAGGPATVASALAAMIEVEDEARWGGQMVAQQVIDYFAERGFTAVLRDVQRSWQYNVVFVRNEFALSHVVTSARARMFQELRKLAGLPEGAAADAAAPEVAAP